MKKVLLLIIIFSITLLAQNQGNNIFGISLKQSKSNENSNYQTKGNTVNRISDATNPNAFILEQNYPNPFNPNTKIQFSIPKESNVNLGV